MYQQVTPIFFGFTSLYAFWRAWNISEIYVRQITPSSSPSYFRVSCITDVLQYNPFIKVFVLNPFDKSSHIMVGNAVIKLMIRSLIAIINASDE